MAKYAQRENDSATITMKNTGNFLQIWLK